MVSSLTIQIDIRVAKIKLRADQIIELNFKDNILLNAEDVYDIYKAVNELSKGEKKALLVQTGEKNKSTLEAKKLTMAMTKDESVALAEAVIIDSLPTRIAANFFYKIYHPPHPSKIFKTKIKAEEWLKQYKKGE